MLTTTNVRLSRLVALRDYGFPLAEQMERKGALNFDLFLVGCDTDCDTEGCLLGWWTTTEYAKNDGWTIRGLLPMWNGLEGRNAANEYFGKDAYYNLFMPSRKDQSPAECLAERRAALDRMIAEKMEA